MAVPKRKISRARRDKRRSHLALKPAGLVTCDHCNQPKLPHRACPNCGYYRGRQVIFPREV
jgi:large subunit ribosomal protein L32